MPPLPPWPASAFSPAPSGEPVDPATVAGTGVGCGDTMSTHGFTRDVAGLGWLFGVVPPGAEQATVTFAGGAEMPLPFHDGLFVVVHPADRRLEKVTFLRHGEALQTCQPRPDDEAGGLPLPFC